MVFPKNIAATTNVNTAQKILHHFASHWESEHVTSLPHCPEVNGIIERIIQTIENTTDKEKRSYKDREMA